MLAVMLVWCCAGLAAGYRHHPRYPWAPGEARIRHHRGRGSRVVKVSDRGLPCHEFEPSTTKDPPCRATMHIKSVES
ncbi:hypothetical protein TNCV_1033461 [Trichonephila clavipes]|nr:hypothetical protein TNCV_1033461 [Trichonephila clavipes]